MTARVPTPIPTMCTFGPWRAQYDITPLCHATLRPRLAWLSLEPQRRAFPFTSPICCAEPSLRGSIPIKMPWRMDSPCDLERSMPPRTKCHPPTRFCHDADTSNVAQDDLVPTCIPYRIVSRLLHSCAHSSATRKATPHQARRPVTTLGRRIRALPSFRRALWGLVLLYNVRQPATYRDIPHMCVGKRVSFVIHAPSEPEPCAMTPSSRPDRSPPSRESSAKTRE
jgi:hypothetical protein